MRHDLTLMQVQAVRAMLADAGVDDDERLILDTLEGETDLFALAGRLLNGIEQDDGDAAVLDKQIEDRLARKKRCKARVEARREALAALMQAAGVSKLPLPEATVSVRDGKPTLIVLNDEAVPDDLQVVKRAPDKKAINAAFADADELPNWLRREDARPVLTIRRA